jgi:hypothetical protein
VTSSPGGGRFRERDAERRHRLPYSVEFRDDDQDRQALAAAHGFVRNVHASNSTSNASSTRCRFRRSLTDSPSGRWPTPPPGGGTNPMIIAHTLINSVAFIGFALLAGQVSWLP